MDQMDISLFDMPQGDRYLFMMYETTEERVRRWIENQRTKTIFSKEEVVNALKIKQKVQITRVKNKMKLKEFDMIILLDQAKYFVWELMNYQKWEHAWKQKYLTE